MKAALLFSFSALVAGKPASSDGFSLIAEPVIDLTSGDAPAYWSAECGGRTYVGSYTLMMDWAQCRDYCTYFPHAAELGHTFSFADILDTDTMECLRHNINNQNTSGNGYDGHYWHWLDLRGDGQWNTKSDQDDKNNGCLCRSKEPGKMVNRAVCPAGWYSVGEKCMRLPSGNKKTWSKAKEYCEYYQAELLAWRLEVYEGVAHCRDILLGAASCQQ